MEVNQNKILGLILFLNHIEIIKQVLEEVFIFKIKLI